MALQKNIDLFFIDGCLRCSLGGTPKCKVNQWREGLETLRIMLVEAGFDETMKWGSPCYQWQGMNAILIAPFKSNFVLSFLYGHVLDDPYGLIEKPGDQSLVSRLIRFTSNDQPAELEDQINHYLHQIKSLTKADIKARRPSSAPEEIPDELQELFERVKGLREAFFALTPGRQRSHTGHISSAKQAQTRITRAEKSMESIWAGKGFNEM
ncbi:MAG TPA: YdeI/OmpD-associated family protein [Luteibaculaceae bacterium]|nr:YdeI/OmpD-associated family protein [Luteibaculaceae bacterium]